MTSRPHLVSRIAAVGGAALALGLIASPAVAATGSGLPADRDTAPGVYVVTLRALPAASYDGGLAGYPATRPAPGHRFDRTRPAVAGYRGRLLAQQDALLRRVGGPRVLYRYTVALDGFAARLDTDQVKALRASGEVARVERSRTQRVDAAAPVPASAATGVVHTRSAADEHAGQGTVIGVVDTGIWPENPSFSGLPQERPGRNGQLPGFHGACAVAQRWDTRDCDDKVVSARWFVRGFGAARIARSDYLSARDGSGHGSHVASTAAGDPDVRVRIDGQGFGTLSGTAPAARLAVYKACWSAPDPADDGCSTADVVAAVDAAVGDGVDVLTSSVADDGGPFGAVQRAYLGAGDAGVVVTASAGNGGPGAAHNAGPWLTTVGASSRPGYRGEVRLGDGTRLLGSMVSDRRVGATRLVAGADAVVPGVPRWRARLCAPGSLDAAEVQGHVVLCDRGYVARVDKSAAVQQAGGVGMVLVNTGPGDTDADVHAVPTVHLDEAEGHRALHYLHAAGEHATVTLDPRPGDRLGSPEVASFSAGGPVSDLLKPDLTAPGVAVLGAVSPGADDGRSFDLLSGTSASAPRVAGLASYLRSVHRTWSPARIKSALVTTAHPLGGRRAALAAGAGEVSPRRLLDPGLVLDSDPGPWRRWLAGDLRTTDLNLPSVTVPDLVGRTTLVRRLTNVGRRTETYVAGVDRPAGVDVVVRPDVLTLRPGQSRTVQVTVLALPDARVDHWTAGALTWTSTRHAVRLPMAVRAREVAAPSSVESSVDRGSVTLRGRADGTVRVRASRLVPAEPTGFSLQPGPFNAAHPVADEDTRAVDVPVPAGAELLRVQLDSANPADDVDLYLYRQGRLVDSATADSPDAALTLTRPTAGDYTLYVNAHRAGNDAAATSQLYTWVVAASPEQDPGSAPVTVTREHAAGGRFRVSARWGRHLDPTRQWLGVVSYAHSHRHTVLSVR